MSKTDTSLLKVGDRLSRISFMEVTDIAFSGRSIRVKNEDGFEWTIEGGIVSQECDSLYVDEEVKMSKTGIAEILVSAKDAIIQVCFDKADGTERVLTGYVLGAEPLLGRTVVIDLEKPKKLRKTKEPGVEWDERQRQVDHRTLKWLIYKGVKYKVK